MTAAGRPDFDARSVPGGSAPFAAEPLYLDHNATTAPCAAAVAAMLDAMQRVWANPSSVHADGQAARAALAAARQRVARFAGCAPAEVVFTSGATESNHMAVLGALAAPQARGDALRDRWALSAVEHPGLLALAEALRRRGTPVDVLPVDGQGRLDPAAARARVGPRTAVISVMAANNETGVLMPTAEIAALANEHGAWLHTDATQWAGKLPLDFAAGGAHLMTLSAHKIGGPKGVGALLVRKGVDLPALLPGRQERQRRGGTENLPGIVGFAAACDATADTLVGEARRQQQLRDRLEQSLLAALPGTEVLGRAVPRLPNTSCLRFGALQAELVLSRLERAGILASSGAACSAGGNRPSHVLMAMGLDADQALGGVRFSLGRTTRAADVEQAIEATVAALGSLLAPGRTAQRRNTVQPTESTT
jgi:cysteine desulfurase